MGGCVGVGTGVLALREVVRLVVELARVAAGVMLAKGIGAVMRNQSGSSQRGRADGRGGGLLDDLFGNNLDGQGQGNLRDRLGQVLGGRSGSQAGTGQAYGGRGSGGAQRPTLLQ